MDIYISVINFYLLTHLLGTIKFYQRELKAKRALI
jgi:hypothetical protein